MHYKIGVICVLYENNDQVLPNKLHGPMHYKIGVTCVFNGHKIMCIQWTRDNVYSMDTR